MSVRDHARAVLRAEQQREDILAGRLDGPRGILRYMETSDALRAAPLAAYVYRVTDPSIREQIATIVKTEIRKSFDENGGMQDASERAAGAVMALLTG